jgi:hypothetical protein
MSILDNLEQIRTYINIHSDSKSTEEYKACMFLLNETMKEVMNLKEIILNNATERANWFYQIKELEAKLSLLRDKIK